MIPINYFTFYYRIGPVRVINDVQNLSSKNRKRHTFTLITIHTHSTLET